MFGRTDDEGYGIQVKGPSWEAIESGLESQKFLPNSIPLLQDATKYFLALGRSGGSPSSTNVMCLDVRGRDRWDWGGTKYLRENKFPPQSGGGN